MRDLKSENDALSKDPVFGSFHAVALEQGRALLEKNPILETVDQQKLLYCLTKYNKQVNGTLNSVLGSAMPLSEEQKVGFINNALNTMIAREGKLVDVFCISKGNEVPWTDKKTGIERFTQKVIIKYGSKLKQITLWDTAVQAYRDLIPGRGYKVTFNEAKNELYPVESPLIAPTDVKLDPKEMLNLIPNSFPVLRPPISTAVKNVLYYAVGIVFKGAGPFYTLDMNDNDAIGEPTNLTVMGLPDGLSGQLIMVVGNIVPSTVEEGGYTMFSNIYLPLSNMGTTNGSNGTSMSNNGNNGNGHSNGQSIDDDAFNDDFNIDQ